MVSTQNTSGYRTISKEKVEGCLDFWPRVAFNSAELSCLMLITLPPPDRSHCWCHYWGCQWWRLPRCTGNNRDVSKSSSLRIFSYLQQVLLTRVLGPLPTIGLVDQQFDVVLVDAHLEHQSTAALHCYWPSPHWTLTRHWSQTDTSWDQRRRKNVWNILSSQEEPVKRLMDNEEHYGTMVAPPIQGSNTKN